MSKPLIEVKDLKVYFKQEISETSVIQAGHPESSRRSKLFY